MTCFMDRTAAKLWPKLTGNRLPPTYLPTYSYDTLILYRLAFIRLPADFLTKNYFLIFG